MIKHILFATDASRQSEKALPYVQQLATTFKAQVTILHGYMYANAAVLMEEAGTKYDSLHDLHREAKQYIQNFFDRVKHPLETQGVKVETTLSDGDAGPLIVKAAKERNCDLIVMGSHGHGLVKSFLLGSVSNFVIHHTQCPIFLIPSNDA